MSAQSSAELDRIADMMRARILDLIRGPWGLGAGYRDGRDWVCCNPLRDDRKPGSFRIGLSGSLQGMVTDFAGEAIPGTGKQSVSPLTFHIHLCHQGDARAGIAWAKAWLGLDGADPEALRHSHRALQAFDDRPMVTDEMVAKRRKQAKAIYLKAGPIAGTPGESYLAGRGIDITRLPWPVNALHFEPRLYCSELGGWECEAAHVPGIVMPINSMGGELVGVHRIWIEEIGGRWVKRRGLKKAKKALGAYVGGVVRIWNGLHVLARTGEVVYGRDLARAGTGLRVHLTEGPETALSIVVALPDERVHCAVALSNLAGLAYPDCVTDLVLWRENDPPGSAAALKFGRAVENFRRQGKRVMIADVASLAPEAKDANDLLMRGGGGC